MVDASIELEGQFAWIACFAQSVTGCQGHFGKVAGAGFAEGEAQLAHGKLENLHQRVEGGPLCVGELAWRQFGDEGEGLFYLAVENARESFSEGLSHRAGLCH